LGSQDFPWEWHLHPCLMRPNSFPALEIPWEYLYTLHS
jgi:hypothetical protein